MTLAATVHPVFDHRALLQTGPDDLARRIGPELAEALERNEPVHLSLTTTEWEALRDQIGPSFDQAVCLPAAERYTHPGAAMAALHEFVHRSVAQGAEAVWSVGSVQIDGDPGRDARWRRYETAVDSVLAHTPLRGICVYDAHAPGAVLDTVFSCHAVIDDPARGRSDSPRYDPYEHQRIEWPHRAVAPALDMAVTRPGDLRRAITTLCDGTLPASRVKDLTLIATELVTNGIRHGGDPVLARVWDQPDEIVLEVIDHGSGIADPYADLRPRRGGSQGGFGLWLVGQFSDQVSIGREHDRTVVVAVVRRPH